MKRFILFLFILFTALSAYCQTSLKEEAETCFDNGDYECAQTKYNEALSMSNARDKQSISLRVRSIAECIKYTKIADEAFDIEDYTVAMTNYKKVLEYNEKDLYAKAQIIKCSPPTTLNVSKERLIFASSGGNETITVTTNADSYSVTQLPVWCSISKLTGSFTVTCEPNRSRNTREDRFNVTAGDKTVEIKVGQTFTNLLSVSKDNINFISSGGKENITVTTNADSYSITQLPVWCSVSKSIGSFTVTCEPNLESKTRNDWFNVTDGDKTITIYVRQTGEESSTNINLTASDATLSVSKDNINFISSGGNENITVFTNASSYLIKLLPTWCSVSKSANSFTITCLPNIGDARIDFFTVTAGDKTVKIHVSQMGQSKKKTRSCFNCPKAKYPFGITFGAGGLYDEDIILGGLQIGFRYEPLFKYGFGLNTGVFYENYSEIDEEEIIARIINVPLHLEYRLNFSKYFNIFFYGGTSLDWYITDPYETYYSGQTKPSLFNLDIGGGIRINHVQLNLTSSANEKISFSFSYMF
jgi:hypothetical protein